jgi:hypothetical protein
MLAAVWNNNLECIKYMHYNECPWDSLCIEVAVTNEYMECLNYLRKNGFPSSRNMKGALYNKYVWR